MKECNNAQTSCGMWGIAVVAAKFHLFVFWLRAWKNSPLNISLRNDGLQDLLKIW